MSLYEAFHVINKGKKADELKGRVFISKAVILLCLAKHNRDADLLSNYVYDAYKGLTDDMIEQEFEEVRKEKMEIPEYVFDCHTLKGKRAGKTKEDFFREEQEALQNRQVSIFDFAN